MNDATTKDDMLKPTIALTPYASGQIFAAGYDPVTKTMTIQFRVKGGPGNIYKYSGVPQEIYDSFCKCESFGRFFNDHMKGKFTHLKIEQPTPDGSVPAQSAA